MWDLDKVVENDQDLWAGNGLKPTNWPDIEKAMAITATELSDALAHKNLAHVKKAFRWHQSIYYVLSATIQNIEEQEKQ